MVKVGDPEPVVTIGFRPYGETDYWPPFDQQQVYVYPDGTAIELVLGGEYADELRPMLMRRFEVERDDVQDLVAKAAIAGLVGGGQQRLVSLPEGAQVHDGGQAVFTAKIDDQHTSRTVDQLEVVAAWDSGDERAAFLALRRQVRAMIATAPIEERTVARWAIVSAPLVDPSVDDDPSVWTGPSLDSIEWQPMADGTLCSIVERADWPYTRAEREDWRLVIDQRQITRRPLLPHESTCSDVATWRTLLAP